LDGGQGHQTQFSLLIPFCPFQSSHYEEGLDMKTISDDGQMDGRSPSDGKSSHGRLPGKLERG